MEQLYYTVCEAGRNLSGGAFGEQVRAATPGIRQVLLDKAGSIASYPMPKIGGASLLDETTAAIRLAFLDIRDRDVGRVIVHVKYLGIEPVTKRAGYFFGHILASLPSCVGALEAVQSWGSPQWRTNDGADVDVDLEGGAEIPRGRSLPDEALLNAWNDPKLMLSTTLPFALTALTCEAEARRVFIVAESTESVRYLISALCLVLPSCLRGRLTFSTRETDVSLCSGQIIGAWDPSVPDYDLPDEFYRSSSKAAIHTTKPNRLTELPERPPFVRFVIECFMQGDLAPLNEFRAAVEKDIFENWSDLAHAWDVWYRHDSLSDNELVAALKNPLHTPLALRSPEAVARAMILLIETGIGPTITGADLVKSHLHGDSTLKIAATSVSTKITDLVQSGSGNHAKAVCLIRGLDQWLPGEWAAYSVELAGGNVTEQASWEVRCAALQMIDPEKIDSVDRRNRKNAWLEKLPIGHIKDLRNHVPSLVTTDEFEWAITKSPPEKMSVVAHAGEFTSAGLNKAVEFMGAWLEAGVEVGVLSAWFAHVAEKGNRIQLLSELREWLEQPDKQPNQQLCEIADLSVSETLGLLAESERAECAYNLISDCKWSDLLDNLAPRSAAMALAHALKYRSEQPPPILSNPDEAHQEENSIVDPALSWQDCLEKANLSGAIREFLRSHDPDLCSEKREFLINFSRVVTSDPPPAVGELVKACNIVGQTQGNAEKDQNKSFGLWSRLFRWQRRSKAAEMHGSRGDGAVFSSPSGFLLAVLQQAEEQRGGPNSSDTLRTIMEVAAQLLGSSEDDLKLIAVLKKKVLEISKCNDPETKRWLHNWKWVLGGAKHPYQDSK